MNLGETIKSARENRGLKLRNVARDIGISPSMLSLIENSKTRTSDELIAALAAKLGGDVDQWFARAGRLRPEALAVFAAVAAEDPNFFREFIARICPPCVRLR